LSNRGPYLTTGAAPPRRTMCFRPSGTSARVTRALMTPPARGVAGPSVRMFSSSCTERMARCMSGLKARQGRHARWVHGRDLW